MEKTHAGIAAATDLLEEIATGAENDAEMEALAAEVVWCTNRSSDGRDGPIAWIWSPFGGIEFVEAL